MSRPHIPWGQVLERAAAIVGEYDTPVTLRQVHYRLVSEPALTYPNTQTAYKGLSSRTAQARRDGWFPGLLDQGRNITRPLTFNDPAEAVAAVAAQYRRDRLATQDRQVWFGVEKATLLPQFRQWLDPAGVPIVPTRGYSSQTFVDDIAQAVDADGREAVLVYFGDFDPSGIDILRDLTERTDCFTKTERVAVNEDQIGRYGLVPAPGKTSDSRAPRFVAEHGRLVQVEVEAIDPADLQSLVADAVVRHVDLERVEEIRRAETAETRQIGMAAAQLSLGMWEGM